MDELLELLSKEEVLEVENQIQKTLAKEINMSAATEINKAKPNFTTNNLSISKTSEVYEKRK